jgi:hypothetical protein
MRCVLLLAALALCACADEEVVYSEAIELRLTSIGPSDVDDGVLEVSRNIATDKGNPFAAFLREAEDDLGYAPRGLELVAGAIAILPDPLTGVSTWSDLWSGEVTLLFEPGGSGARIDVARVVLPTQGLETWPLQVVATRAELSVDKVLSGDFKVVLRGSTDRGPKEAFAAGIELRLLFAAY